MKSRITKLAAAVVIVVAAVALGMKKLALIRSDKAYAFMAQIHDNTALDLDPGTVLPLKNRRPDRFDVGWDSENGGALTVTAGSPARMLAVPLLGENWEDAVSWARGSLAELKNSTTRSVLPADSKFVAVLTNKGNLAVIKIGGHNAKQAWLCWRVERPLEPGFSPVRVVTLYDIDHPTTKDRECAIDFDRGELLAIPSGVLQMQDEEAPEWLAQNGIDAVAEIADKECGLIGTGLAFHTQDAAAWNRTSAVELHADSASFSHQPRFPMSYRQGQYQPAVPFRTREGGLGILQILAVDRLKRSVSFRYKVLQEGGTQEIEKDPALEPFAVSAERLHAFVLTVLIYANDHDDKLPDTLQKLEEYLEDEQDLQWLLDNVEYLGKGKTTADPFTLVIAYDKTLLKKGNGTYVLFLDSHTEFIGPKEFNELGITTGKRR